MSWNVNLSKKAEKQAKRLPPKMLELLEVLVLDLIKLGPVLFEWPNYSKLNHKRYHCHLNYHYVAVWEIRDKKIRVLEVIYVGSRENAPY